METISSHQWNFISRESKNLWLHVELPRAERFKWENIIVIGIVPSLNREPKDLNQFLEPAIDELKAMWKGVRLWSCLSRFTLTFRVAVISISSDIPATRKICGFQGHSAYLGCPRCLKTFPGGFREKKKHYSGLERNSWTPHINQDHCSQAITMPRSKTKAEYNLIGQNSGISHYSVLLDLEYFDITRFGTVDPTHNLFLGTVYV